MAKSEVTTTAIINGEKITVYVDEQEFYNEVKIELLKNNKKLNEFLAEQFAEFVNKSEFGIATNKDDKDLKKKVKAVLSLKNMSMKDLIDSEMQKLIN